ncbi:MAG: phenylalanine--tRNA ligase subunit alpha, partial [Oscillospiraceae bacterium]
MNEAIERITQTALAEMTAAETPAALDAARVRFLGKKGELTSILKGMGMLSSEERKNVGLLANEARTAIENALGKKLLELKTKEQNQRLAAEILDVTMPGKK